MKSSRKKLVVAAAFTVTVAAGVTAAGVAYADSAHYYVEIGGTGSTVAEPECTSTYRSANQHLDGGIAVPVCYPASFGPFIGSDNAQPAPGAPAYNDSVKQGYDNLLKAVTDTHHNDPSAQITIVGYSQGADVADRVLETIAGGQTDIPLELVSGKLYADPRQPETGIWAKVPKDVGVPGVTSPGAGPTDFAAIPVERHCVHKDGICDATSIESIPGYFTVHPVYPQAGGIMDQTIAQPAVNGVVWHD